ncbi:MAG: M24 family metallopeptidase, partial [Candidatus Rokuibacteriota bacterium]
YLSGYHPGRSERLIALLLPAVGEPAIVCPAFEVERIKRQSAVAEVLGWEEQNDPYTLVRDTARRLRGRGTAKVALEPTTDYHTFRRLADTLSGWDWTDGTPLWERLRLIKYAEEIALIRRAVEITEAAIAATFAQLAGGMTEREVARLLSREMEQRGGSGGGGLIQFGASSALPHGGPGDSALARETVVLIDAGCRVGGYTSDITRTIWFGDAPSDEFRQVFNLVHDAQTAAMTLATPQRTQCQQLDQAARRVITAAGLGAAFTHRLGHGMGMDGHEAPYLVEGNDMILEPGMVFTIEPGIYQLEKFGVRIEDDCLVTEAGLEVLSHRPPKL